MRAYLYFCELFQDSVQPYPCGSTQVCMYMTFLARRLCYSSIRQYLSGLNNHLRELGCEAIDYKDHKVKSCMTGIRRSLGDAPRQAPPLLPKHLLSVFAVMRDSPGHVCVRAAMLVSFRALLRKAHVTESDCTLERRDFRFYRWGMMLTIRRSKTIQFRERVHRVPVAYVEETRLCAVTWVREHFRQAPAPGSSGAFRMPRGRGSTVLTYAYYMAAIKCLTERAVMEPGQFSTHSLRRGGATFLRMCGASIQEIKERGDWRSDAVYEYLQASLLERLTLDMRVAAILGTF